MQNPQFGRDGVGLKLWDLVSYEPFAKTADQYEKTVETEENPRFRIRFSIESCLKSRRQNHRGGRKQRGLAEKKESKMLKFEN